MDIFGIPVAWLFRVPVILSSQLSYRDALYTRGERFLLPVTDWMSDRVVVNSKAVEQHLVEKGIRAERLYVSHNGVDISVFHPAPVARPAALRDASLVIGSVCALRSEKRLDILVEAFAKVCGLRPGMKLAILGSGGGLARIEALSESLGIRSSCHFEPARPDVVDWMRAMDVFVLSSSVESFPNALLEAMACGCAVIGSQVGGVPELITDGKTGLLFESGNAAALADRLSRLIQADELRAELGRQASNRARTEFSVQLNIARAEHLYESLLERKGRLKMSPSSASAEANSTPSTTVERL
jgi:glycosyltransferase involved in cell wall biosynthesis